jgi:hypothetical protein
MVHFAELDENKIASLCQEGHFESHFSRHLARGEK